MARVHFAPGEQVRAESGAMAMHSFGVTVEAQMRGGVMGALKRGVLGGESLFVTTFTGHETANTWVDFAANLPGDIWVTDVTAGPQPGDYARVLACQRGWGRDRYQVWWAHHVWWRRRRLCLHASGQGEVVLAAYGALDTHNLEQGQGFTVDSGHLWRTTTPFRCRCVRRRPEWCRP